ncbi:MAG: hypothetical protein Q4F50_13535 [Bacteroides sp.]|uniref:hypothetical protein n=1 Tax=Bacteroides sp. TaxID=29523 RepID=UPI0026DF1EBD|nr:hypothetical protein [Bacteroides sp.]MDO5421069.1 hypothetical protein [Bacteroides sp.]
MKRTYIYPPPFLSILIGIVCFICFYIAILPEITTVATLLLTAAGLLTLCTTFYVFPIISFDNQQIYIFRFLPGTAKRIRWEEIRNISPLGNGGGMGLSCLICTDNKKYTLTIFLKGWYKLLKHWDAIHSVKETVLLQRKQLPAGIYRKPFWKNSGFFLSLFALCLLGISSYTTCNGWRNSIIGGVGLFIIITIVFLLLYGCYFNYYEFTATHFCIRSPFPFWNYKIRWEDIHSIRQYSTKANFISICTRQYRYKYIMMGYLLPKEILIQLQAAGISIE